MSRSHLGVTAMALALAVPAAHALSPHAHRPVQPDLASRRTFPAPGSVTDAFGSRGLKVEGALFNADGMLRTLRGLLAEAGTEAPEANARAFLLRHHALLDAPPVSDAFALERIIESPMGTTVRFRRQHAGHPVEPGSVAVHLGKEGRVRFVGSELTRAKLPEAGADLFGIGPEQAVAAALSHVGVKGELLTRPEPRRLFRVFDGEAKPVTEVLLTATEPLGDWQVTLDAAGKVLQVVDRIQYAHGTVFKANAVVAMEDPTLQDGDDAASAVPAAAYSQVELLGLDDSGNLTGPFVSTENTANRVHSNDGTFHFDRSQKAFEEVMIYYHLDFAQRYFQELGFDNVNNRQQKVDAHTDNNDNSFYRPGTKHLYFGDGGVDDAEDGEVIWHEYGHSTQDNQVPGWGSGGDARAMGEAFGDFLGGAISEKISLFQSACVADWDGVAYSNTTPPCLRRLDGTKHYPEDLNGSVHADGEIWSASLWQIYNGIGSKDDAVRLVLAHHFLLAPGSTMPQAAEALLAADQQLFDGANLGLIKQVMVARGILEESAEITVSLKDTAGAPLSGTAVLTGAETIELEIPASGQVTRLVTPGSYTLAVESFGYIAPAPLQLELAADDVASEAFALAAAETGVLTGHVTAEDGSGIAASVRLVGTPLAPVTAEADGSFSITAPAGSYQLQAAAFGFAVGAADVTVPSGGVTVTLAQLPPVLLVDDDSSSNGTDHGFETYFEAALEASGHGDFLTRKSWEITGEADLLPFQAVVWFTGGRTSDILKQAGQRHAVEAYLAAGGRLILSGQDIGYALKSDAWLKSTLGVVFVKDKSEDNHVEGAGLSLDLGGDSANNQKYPEVIDAAEGSTLWLRYGDSQGAALLHDEGPGRVVFVGFGLEGVDGAASRTALMGACFDAAGAAAVRRRAVRSEWFTR